MHIKFEGFEHMILKFLRVVLIFSVSLVFFAGCHETSTQPTSVEPVVQSIQAPEKVYTESNEMITIRVNAWDPQGVSDLKTVTFTLLDSSGAFASGHFNDDGTDGDIIPGDGQFTGVFSGKDFAGHGTRVFLQVAAEDQEGHVSSPARDTILVHSGKMNALPKIISITLPDSVNLAVDSVLTLSAALTDPDGEADLLGLGVQVFPAQGVSPVWQDTLFYTGASGTGQIEGQLPILIFKNKQGEYIFRLTALDKSGGSSEAVIRMVHVFKIVHNDPPVLSELSAPDTVSRSSGQHFVLSVRVTDPQGLADVSQVYFNTYKPDGTPSSGNPFFMRDDGQGGDATAHDGIYSLGISISTQNATGNYRFVFYAVDYSGAVSQPIVHIITVVP
ncbi:MAG: hypothetical protein GXO76_03165 [Calditrichaeota bacterium]|nr:hypothetical protein [Calditrichota bacterium]